MQQLNWRIAALDRQIMPGVIGTISQDVFTTTVNQLASCLMGLQMDVVFMPSSMTLNGGEMFSCCHF